MLSTHQGGKSAAGVSVS